MENGRMLSRLNQNERPRTFWKGKTFNQIVSSVRKNTDDGEATALMFRARPIKGYRREIATKSAGNWRAAATVGQMMDMPAATIVNSAVTDCGAGGLAAVVDFNQTTNQSERPCGDQNSADTVTNAAINARRRVRSAGMNPNKYNGVDSVYKSSYAQYNVARVKTFQQNQYNYLKEGEKTATPGDNLSMNNVYSSYSTGTCQPPIYYKPNNPNYGVQGAVTASERILRTKYNEVTKASSNFRTTVGEAYSLANQYAYGVNNTQIANSRLKKFPPKQTPVVDALTGELKCCNTFLIKKK